MSLCSDCGRKFRTPQALHDHCRSKQDHSYCGACERLFADSDALSQHLRNAAVHRESSADDCEKSEDDSDKDDFCVACKRRFINKESLYQHLASARHNWCFTCSRDFSSESALENHLSSLVHNARDHPCPLCSKAFKVPSAIALHIESGACYDISRHQVTAVVHSLQINAAISMPDTLEPPRTETRTSVCFSATDKAFNGSAYECYICHDTFKTLRSLNAHLESPAHDADEFKCPKCKVPFKLISGLVQHIESDACGVAKFKQVEDYMTSLTPMFSKLLRV